MDEMEFDEDATALYRLYGEDDTLLYVGIAFDPPKRMYQHAYKQPWWQEVCRKTMVWYTTRAAASRAETEAIAAEHPRYNKMVQSSPGMGAQARANWTEEMRWRYDCGEVIWIPGTDHGFRKTY